MGDGLFCCIAKETVLLEDAWGLMEDDRRPCHSVGIIRPGNALHFVTDSHTMEHELDGEICGKSDLSGSRLLAGIKQGE